MDLYNVHVLVLAVMYHSQCVVGQCDSGTKPLYLSASSQAQYFTSPNYPLDYPPNSNCKWIVTAPGGYDKIIINIEEFFTQQTNDQLTVYDGSGLGKVQIATMDKSNRNDYNVLVSSEDSMEFVFTSDGSTEDVGFQILYFSNDTSTQYACGETISVTASTQVLMSPNLPDPYNSTHSCYWSFDAPDLILFSIKMIDMQCWGNVQLSMYNGNGTANLLERECATSQVYEFTDVLTSMTTAYIDWTVLDETSDYFGFMLTFRLTGPENVYTTCNETGYNITANIYPKYDHLESPNFGGDNEYPSNTDCMWYITAPDNYSVQVSFDQSAYGIEYNYYCSWDYLIIYDGHNSTTDSQLNRLCGTSVPEYNYRSTNSNMLLIFSSDYALQYEGFRLIVTAKLNTYPGCVDNYDEYSVTYNTKYDYVFNNETYINNLSTPSFGYDYYYGYTKYPNNLELFWLLTNDNTTYYKMVIELQDVNIENSYNCLYDKLIIYDGPCIADGVYDQICGYWAKRWDLTGPEYLLHFHSDNSFNYGGFLLDYYAELNDITPPPTSQRTTTNGPPVEAVVNAIKDVLTNYSSENFPVKNISLAVTASLDFFLVGINGIDEVEQKLTTTGQFEVTWRDESLSWDPTKRQGIVKMLLPQNDLWKPDIALMNGFSKITAMGSSFMFIDVDYDGSCLWKPFQIMESVCKVDLTHYPYDRQTCVLKFGTWGTDDSEVITELGALGLQIHPSFQDHSEWRLISHRTEQEDKNNHKIVEFFLTLERNPQYVSYYMTLPIVMLAYLNVFTFVVPTESGEKTGFSITIFLSFVVLLIITNSSMPENSDSISLYAAYLLILTILSAIGLMICVLQVKALTLIEWRYPRYSCLVKTVRAIKKLRSFKLCRSEKPKDDESISEITVYDSDKEQLLGNDDVSEHSFSEVKLKKKRSVAFIGDEISSPGERTPESLLGHDGPSNRKLNRETTLFMEYADMRPPTQPASMLVATQSTSLDDKRLDDDGDGDDGDENDLNSYEEDSSSADDTDSDLDDEDQLPESNILQVKSVTEHNLPSRSSSKDHTRTVSFGAHTDVIITPTAIEQPVTVHNSNSVDADVAEIADPVHGSTESQPHNPPQHEAIHANDTRANASNEDNTNSASSFSVERTKSMVSIQSFKDKDQLPLSREPTNNFEVIDTIGDEKMSCNESNQTKPGIYQEEPDEHGNKERQETEIGVTDKVDLGNEKQPGEDNNTSEPKKHLTGESNTDNYEIEANGISANSGIAVDKQMYSTPDQSSQSSLRKIKDDHNLNESVLEGDNNGSGSLLDSVSIKQTSEAVEYRMMGPSSASPSRQNSLVPNSIGTMRSDASSRPLSSAITFADQRPISRQHRLSLNNSPEVDQSSSDKRPSSRSLSKGDDGQSSSVNKQPLSNSITCEDQRPVSQQLSLSSKHSRAIDQSSRPLSSAKMFEDQIPISHQLGSYSSNSHAVDSRPLSSAITFSDQRPISRQIRLSSNTSYTVDQSSPDKRPFSRSQSRGNDGLNQQPVSRMSQRIGLGLMGNPLDTQRLINGIDNTDTLNNDFDMRDTQDSDDSTSVKSVQDNASVSTITTDEVDEDEISWSDVVSCSDFICFLVFMVITTILTLALFMTMILAF